MAVFTSVFLFGCSKRLTFLILLCAVLSVSLCSPGYATVQPLGIKEMLKAVPALSDGYQETTTLPDLLKGPHSVTWVPYDAKTTAVVPATNHSMCHDYVNKFSKAAAHFYECIVHNARPVRVCEKCIDKFLIAMIIFDNITKAEYKEHETCWSYLLDNTNKTQVVLDVNNSILSAWTLYNCQNCFAMFNINDLLTNYVATNETSLSNETKEFFEMTRRLEECIYNISAMSQAPIFQSNHTINGSVCSLCWHAYNELNTFYSETEKQFKRKVCIDLSDSINTTRHIWHIDFQCKATFADATVAIIVSVLIGCLPAVFYVLARVYARYDDNERTLVKQKRLGIVHRRHTHRPSVPRSSVPLQPTDIIAE